MEVLTIGNLPYKQLKQIHKRSLEDQILLSLRQT
jgi:hypothetical protein